MQLTKWIKRLRREAQANPKKAAALGLLLAVALWFWAPLLKSWVAKSEPGAKAIAQTQTKDGPATPPPATPGMSASGASQEQAPTYAWDEWVKCFEQDPRTKAAEFAATDRDPFHAVARPVAEETVKKKVEPVKVTVTPASLAMRLTSTVVGSSPRLATISGRVYKEGDTFEVTKDSRKADFTLAEVDARRVVLLSQGERFELVLPERRHSGRLELSGGR